jgi:hypothetical protein
VTTAAIAAGASNATVQTAVRLLPGYGSVTVGDPAAGVGYKLTLTSAPLPNPKVTLVDSSLAVAGTAEVQTISIVDNAGSDVPAAGSFRIRWKDLVDHVAQVIDSPALAYNASAATIQAALRKCYADETLTATGTLADNIVVTFVGNKRPMQLLEIVDSTVVNAGDAEVQTLTFSDVPTSGGYTLQIGQVEMSLNYDEDATAIQGVLQASDAAFGSATVTGTFGTAFTFTFTGHAADNIPTILVKSNTLAIVQVFEEQLVEFDEVPDAGAFTLDLDGEVSPSVEHDAATPAADLQAWVRTIEGYESVTVDGNFTSGFTFTFIGVDGDIPELVEGDNTLENTETPVVITITEDVEAVAPVFPITIAKATTLQGGKKKIVTTTTRTTPGVAAVAVTATVAENTVGDAAALAESVAAEGVLDRLDGGERGAVYAMSEFTTGSLKITERF